MHDLRFAFRQLLKNPGFTAVAVLTLALGIGANTAIFSVLDAVLLRMLPVRNPEQLLALNHAGGDRRGNGFAYPVFERLRDQNQSFSTLFAFSTWPESITTVNGREEPLPGGVLLVSGDYHTGLGIRPWLGRLISPEDNRVLGGHPVAVSSYGFWQRRFGGAPSVIGQSIPLNGTPFTIIGVTPPERLKIIQDRRIDLTQASQGLSALRSRLVRSHFSEPKNARPRFCLQESSSVFVGQPDARILFRPGVQSLQTTARTNRQRPRGHFGHSFA